MQHQGHVSFADFVYLPMMIAPVVLASCGATCIIKPLEPLIAFLIALAAKVDWLGEYALTSVIVADIWQWSPFIFILALAALQSLEIRA